MYASHAAGPSGCRRTGPRLFPSPRRGRPHDAVHRALIRSSAHPSTRSPSTEYLRASRSPWTFRPRLRLSGSFALFATSRSCSHSVRRFPTPRYVRPQAFAASRRLLPHETLAGLFHPAATSRARSFRGFSPRAATLPRRKEPAPLPLGQSRSPASRLATPLPLDFEAFIRAGPRSPRAGYSPASRVAPLLEILLLQAPRLDRAPSLPVRRTLDVPLEDLRSRARPRTSSSVSSIQPPAAPSPVQPTCSSFRA